MAKEKVTDRIVEMIRQYVESLKDEGIYDEKKKEVTQFVMRESNFAYLKDKELKDTSDDIIEVSEYDIDRQFDLSEVKLSGSGAGMKYRRKYTAGDYQETKIDVILFTLSEKCMDDVEKMAKDGFECWIRNEPRKTWALSIKYEDKDGTHTMYPDLIIVRKESDTYTVSLLEPHWETTKDNYYKAKATPILSRLELIRVVDNNIWRLNFKDAQVRHQMDNVTDNENLDRLFKKLNS